MSNTPTHTLSVLVEDKPGVLARVASLFSRRGYNIQSLAVGATEQKDMSRMTIVVSVDESPLEQITKQLNKLINVIKIVEQDEDNSVSRELALVKVRTDADHPRAGHRSGEPVPREGRRRVDRIADDRSDRNACESWKRSCACSSPTASASWCSPESCRCRAVRAASASSKRQTSKQQNEEKEIQWQ